MLPYRLSQRLIKKNVKLMSLWERLRKIYSLMKRKVHVECIQVFLDTEQTAMDM